MNLQRAIGGFFELECISGDREYHLNGHGLSNGRACFTVILRHTRPAVVHVPFYCCDTLLLPLDAEGIRYNFYPLDEKFEAAALPELNDDELFLYINYYGLKGEYVRSLVARYGDRLIVDNTQGYFEKDYSRGWAFNSARKYFGVPDGAYLYGPKNLEINYHRNTNFITDHLVLRLDGRQQQAYQYFRQNEDLQTSVPYKISTFSETLLKNVDYEEVATRRRSNFMFYSRHLGKLNRLDDLHLENGAVPFCYPFLGDRKFDHQLFLQENIFLPVLWTEVIGRKSGPDYLFERTVAGGLLPLPVDHRYNETDLARVIDLINQAT